MFEPLYWIHVPGQSKAAGATALTLFALTGVCGNLLGGRLADRFGSTTTYRPLGILGQAYLPNHIGLSSGVTLAVLSFLPLVSAGLALTFPRPALHSSTRA